MAGDYLLDTSIAVDFLRGVPAIASRVSSAAGVCICATVLGELLYGAERSRRKEESLRRIDDFLRDCPVRVCDATTSAVYARIRAALAARGTPIPENDVWIAAVAIQHGLKLAARDEHFRSVDGLDVEWW